MDPLGPLPLPNIRRPLVVTTPLSVGTFDLFNISDINIFIISIYLSGPLAGGSGTGRRVREGKDILVAIHLSPSMASTYLVTGGAGFIGSHLAERLLDKGNDVVCLDSLNDYYDVSVKRANLALLRRRDGFSFVKGDIRDVRLLKRVFRRYDPDIVLHQAAQAGVRYSVEHPHDVMETNVTGTLNLLEACRRSSVKRFINASSSSVYGVVERLPFDEGHPKSPISPYGVSKLAAEHYVRVFDEVHGIRGVSLRYFTVFGPRMRPDLAIHIFTKAALRNRQIRIFGTGKKTRDFTYIDNIVDGTLRAVRRGRGVYNLGSGKRVDISGLARKIKALTGSRSKVVHLKDAEGDMEHTLSSIKRAERELGYRVSVDLDTGLRRFVEWVRSAGKA